jgi:hypothetical protein
LWLPNADKTLKGTGTAREALLMGNYRQRRQSMRLWGGAKGQERRTSDASLKGNQRRKNLTSHGNGRLKRERRTNTVVSAVEHIL